jgi:prophage tail gpP-like protein
MANVSYLVQAGDTFESIAIKLNGEPGASAEIAQANPGSFDPPTPGTVLIVPIQTDAPARATGRPALGDVELQIAGSTVEAVESISFTLHIDAVSTVEVTLPLAGSAPYREAIKPFEYSPLDVFVEGDLVLRGTMVDVAPSVDVQRGSLVQLRGYSRPGVLSDCTMPVSAFPLQLNGSNIADIASTMARPFNIKVERPADVGGPFRRVRIDPTQKVLAFLAKLAKQRKIMLRSGPSGALVLAGPPAQTPPVARLRQGESPVLAVTAQFNPQSYYSHVSATRSKGRRRSGLGSVTTVPNSQAQRRGVLRPLTVSLSDVAKGELPAAAEAAAGRMLANSAQYTVTVATWRDPDGALWEPGTMVELEAPDAFVRRPYRFHVHSVRFSRTVESDVAEMRLVLPGAFDGVAPDVLPWD